MRGIPELVQGFCPNGCGATLMLGSGGYVTCSWNGCPRPERAAELMALWPRGIDAKYEALSTRPRAARRVGA